MCDPTRSDEVLFLMKPFLLDLFSCLVKHRVTGSTGISPGLASAFAGVFESGLVRWAYVRLLFLLVIWRLVTMEVHMGQRECRM